MRSVTAMLALTLLFLAAHADAAGIPTATYLPLQDGNSWTYEQEGGGTSTETVLPGTVDVNGTPTKMLQTSDGSQTFLTNDASGIRQHRLRDPEFFIEGLGTFDATVTFSPPLTFVPATATLGQTVDSNGTATFLVLGFPQVDLAYSASSTLEALETVTVPYGTFTAVKIVTVLTIVGTIGTETLNETVTQTNWVADHIGVVKADEFGLGVESLSSTTVTPPSIALSASVLPGSRAVQTGQTATAFATILAAGSGTATGCSIAPATSPPATTFMFVKTNPATNEVIPPLDAAVDIAAGTGQSFLIAFTPGLELAPTVVPLYFDCANTGPAAILPGVNTLTLAALDSAGPDVIALSATPSADGILSIPVPPGVAAFAVAAANVGAAGTITATADTGGPAGTLTAAAEAGLPLTLTLCQTDPLGACTNPLFPESHVVVEVDPGETLTFSIFATASDAIAFDPAAHRITVRFVDTGIERGSTSVAVRTVP